MKGAEQNLYSLWPDCHWWLSCRSGFRITYKDLCVQASGSSGAQVPNTP